MGAIAGFMGPFLDYLRPTKSPYLVIQFVAVLVTCYKVTHVDATPDKLDSPGFFLPIFVLVIAIVPLSFLRRDHLDKNDSSAQPVNKEQVINSKYENDLDGVFKFSRALCLASAVIMLLIYFQTTPVDNWYATIAYTMIIAQMTTFLLYTVFRHFKGEDVSNINLFQIAFITAVFFVGSSYLSTQIKDSEPEIRYLYYCKSKTIEFLDVSQTAVTSRCDDSSFNGQNISKIILAYSFDYRQISFALFAICWLIYEIFWLKILLVMSTLRSSTQRTENRT